MLFFFFFCKLALAIPHSHTLASPCFVLCLVGVETEGLLGYQGTAGIIFIVRWNLRPVIFGVDLCVCVCFFSSPYFKSEKNSLNIKFLGGIFLGHPGPRRRDIPDQNFMQVAFTCCFRQGVAGVSRDLGRDIPDLEKLYARKLWADFSYPTIVRDICCPRRWLEVLLIVFASLVPLL